MKNKKIVLSDSHKTKLPWLTEGYYLEDIPEEWRPKYVLKRIKGDQIELTYEQRMNILKNIESGKRFVQIGEYTLMINSINCIDPYYGEENRPNRPRSVLEQAFNEQRGICEVTETEHKKAKLWDKLFNKEIKYMKKARKLFKTHQKQLKA